MRMLDLGDRQMLKRPKVVGNQSKGIVGTAQPGATIEAINLTTSPAFRLRTIDTRAIGKANADGKFHGTLPDLREGDQFAVRSRLNGKKDTEETRVSPWVVVDAKGLESKDTRNAVVNLDRIGFERLGSGDLYLLNIDPVRRISELDTTLQLTNERTGKKTKIKADLGLGTGLFEEVKAEPGDVLSVAISDRRNNLDFKIEAGKLTVPGGPKVSGDKLPEPWLTEDQEGDFSTKRFTGPLFKDGPSAHDVKQGQIDDCLLAGAVAAIAHTHPDLLRRIIIDKGDGTYTVKLRNGRARETVTVDGDLYVRPSGAPLYGTAEGLDQTPGTMELWYPVLEKAFAVGQGRFSYQRLDRGGWPNDIFAALLGNGHVEEADGAEPEKVWAQIKRAVDRNWPLTIGTARSTKGSDETPSWDAFPNSGLYPRHVYTVLGYEDRDGEKYVTLRNPMAEGEPGDDGTNDGVFSIRFSELKKFTSALMWAELRKST